MVNVCKLVCLQYLLSVNCHYDDSDGAVNEIATDETLRTLFIVSDVVLADEGDLGTGDLSWAFTGSVDIPGSYHFYLLVGLVQTAFHRKRR